MTSGNMTFKVALQEARLQASRNKMFPRARLRLLQRVIDQPMRVDPGSGRMINVLLKVEKWVRLELELTEIDIDWRAWVDWIVENLPEIIRFILMLLAFLDDPTEG
jgi:hypothetical protein